MFTLKHEPLNRDRILSLVSEEEIFKKYLGMYPEYTHPYCNPLRTDKHPSCWFYVDDRGRIKFIDHSQGWNLDCFNVVEFKYKLSFSDVLKRIAFDFGITDTSTSLLPDYTTLVKERRKKEKLGIRIKRRSWNIEVDKNYWNGKYTFASDYLNSLRISPVSHAWWSKAGGLINELFYVYKANDPCYVYHFPSYGEYEYKLYFPYREKGNKFRQTRGDIIQGLDLLPPKGHILIITKSYKDKAAIELFSKIFDVWAIAPMSETQLIPPEVYIDLQNRFDYIFTLFDFDRTGINLMRKYEQTYGTPWFMLGLDFKRVGIKDISDHIDKTKKGLDISETYNLLKYVYEQRIAA